MCFWEYTGESPTKNVPPIKKQTNTVARVLWEVYNGNYLFEMGLH